jgi:general secretion pathway protein B
VPAPPTPAAGLTAGTLAGGAAANARGAGNGESNPDDYAPAEEASARPGSSLGGHVRRGTANGVPLYQDAAATAGAQLPQLRLDLHVYAARPQDRFVMINMHKLREGDSLPEGVHVESIVPEGAVLSYKGSRFLLPRE